MNWHQQGAGIWQPTWPRSVPAIVGSPTQIPPALIGLRLDFAGVYGDPNLMFWETTNPVGLVIAPQ